MSALEDQETEHPPIAYRQGDATAPTGEGNRIIVHICNDQGGWGRGFVLALSARWSEPERAYRAWHRGEIKQPFALGEVLLVEAAPSIFVANLIGQHDVHVQDGRPPIRYQAVADGLAMVRVLAKQKNATVHMPRIGCGLAGGSWERIGPIVTEELASHGVTVTVYDFTP